MHHDQQMLSSFDLVRMSQLTAHQRRGFIVFVSSQARAYTRRRRLTGPAHPLTDVDRAATSSNAGSTAAVVCASATGDCRGSGAGGPCLTVRASRRGMLFERTAGVMRLTVG
jgi:phage tail tape-measure protein